MQPEEMFIQSEIMNYLFVVVAVTVVVVVVFMKMRQQSDFNPHPLLSLARVHDRFARDYLRCRTYDL